MTGASGDIGVAVCERLVRAGFQVFAPFKTREERVRRLRESLGDSGALLRPAILATTPLGRCIEAQEIASVVVAWATGFSAVTGQTLVVDGGRVLH